MTDELVANHCGISGGVVQGGIVGILLLTRSTRAIRAETLRNEWKKKDIVRILRRGAILASVIMFTHMRYDLFHFLSTSVNLFQGKGQKYDEPHKYLLYMEDDNKRS